MAVNNSYIDTERVKGAVLEKYFVTYFMYDFVHWFDVVVWATRRASDPPQ